MNLTYTELIELQLGLSIISKIEGIKDFRLKTIIARNLKKISAELVDIYEVERIKLIEIYAVRDNDGKMISTQNNTIEIKDQQAFNAESKKLQLTRAEVSLEKLTQKELEELPEQVQEKLTAEIIQTILPILVEETN